MQDTAIAMSMPVWDRVAGFAGSCAHLAFEMWTGKEIARGTPPPMGRVRPSTQGYVKTPLRQSSSICSQSSAVKALHPSRVTQPSVLLIQISFADTLSILAATHPIVLEMTPPMVVSITVDPMRPYLLS